MDLANKADKGTVVLGMSGGVDSSVAAKLLKDEGYTVIGMFMNCGVDKERWPTSISWDDEEKEVRDVCEALDIDFVIKDCGEGYEKKVISEMFRDYAIGLTPNPDILCNNVGKFPLLYSVMEEKGADFIATGHYVQSRTVDGKAELLMGYDKTRDQSYFLIGLPQKILKKCLFPIGGYTKDDVRLIAKDSGFSNWDKKGSRGICYLGKIDMKDFLHSRIQKKEGQLLDDKNRVIGTHPGISFFTIGETITDSKGTVLNSEGRKLYSSERLYVAAKKKGNQLIVASKGSDALLTSQVIVKNFTLINPEEEVLNSHFDARIRHLGDLKRGILTMENGEYVFTFDTQLEGVAPGQYVVLYDGLRVVGGGEMRLLSSE